MATFFKNMRQAGFCFYFLYFHKTDEAIFFSSKTNEAPFLFIFSIENVDILILTYE